MPRIPLVNPHRESLFRPLQTEYQCIYADPAKPLDVIRQKPGRLPILPSIQNPHVRIPCNSALQQRSTFPYFSSTRYSSPNTLPAPDIFSLEKSLLIVLCTKIS